MPRKRKKKQDSDDQQPETEHDDLPDPSELQIVIDGKPRRFTDYTRDFTRQHYPDVGHSLVMVPPLEFHQNWLSTSKDHTQRLQALPGSSAFRDVTVTLHREDTKRSSLAEYVVAEGFRHLGECLGGPCAVILGHKYENYLKKVKKQLIGVRRPADFGDERGEHDLLFLHPPSGALVVSVKSVGGNFADLGKSLQEQEETLLTVLGKATAQLENEVKVVEHVLSDLSPPVTSALALPNIPRHLLTSALQRNSEMKERLDGLMKGDSTVLCLCSEQFPPLGNLSGCGTEADDNWKTCLTSWFERRFPNMTGPPAFSQEQYEDVFGRYCGLFSTVEIHHRRSEGRIEVRRLPEAVVEVNRRFRCLVLLPEQSALLCQSLRRVYLYGLMGSGKSVMLCLKARHWINCGADVIIVNVNYDGHGSPIGFRLLEEIRASSDGHGEVYILNVRLANLDKQQLLQTIHNKIAEMRKTETEAAASASGSADSGHERPVNFILDEVYPKFQPVFEVILGNFPDAEIWAAGLVGETTPEGFHAVEMAKVLRNPPTVQKLLQCTDYEPSRRDRYTTCGAKEGLPTEGPDVIYIHHSNHSPSSSPSPPLPPSFSFLAPYWPLCCSECARETRKVFSEVLGLSSRSVSSSQLLSEGATPTTTHAQPSTSSPSKKKSSQPSKEKSTPPRLSLNDVVLLCKDPEQRRVYPKLEDGSYRLDAELFRDFVDAVDKSAYVKELREEGFPVHTVHDPNSGELAGVLRGAGGGGGGGGGGREEGRVTASWVNPASGLEWAVVIFAPGDPPEPAAPDPSQLPPSEEEVTSDPTSVLKRMSERDVKYLFWAASRCTAQMVVIVP